MAKTRACIYGFFTFLIVSCGNNYEYWELSKFRMDNTALENSEEVKLLYSSRGPDYNRELEYYVHLIAVSQKTGDTVNILTTVINAISMDDSDNIFIFFNQDNAVSKIAQMDSEQIKDLKNVDEINKAGLKKIDKVARDPRFDDIADNNYPTIIGTIVTRTKTDELEKLP